MSICPKHDAPRVLCGCSATAKTTKPTPEPVDPLADAIQTIGSAMETSATLDPKLLDRFHAFGLFLTWQFCAIKDRLAGHIDAASKSEREADGFYKRLPKEWQW